MNDYKQYEGPLMGALGVALQFLRAVAGFPEWAYFSLAFLFAAGGFFVLNPLAPDWRLNVIQAVIVTTTNMGTLMGGTFITAKLANGASAEAKAHPMIPATNSK